MNKIINAVTNAVKSSLTFHHEGGSMLRNLSILVVVALISATGVVAQDWGTDADSIITIMGAVGAVDMPGEGAMKVGGMDIVDAGVESTQVQAVFNMGIIGSNADSPVMPGDTVWVPYFVKNMSNGPDSININATISSTSMDVLDALIASDEEGDTMINLMGTDFIASPTGNYGLYLAEDAEKILFIGVIVPDSAVDGDTAVYDITVNGNTGTGSDDLWPSNYPAYVLASDNGDQQTDQFMVSIGMPVIYFATTASAPTAVPGDTITYTLAYDNDGSDSTNVAGGAQLYITQMLPRFVSYATGTFDYSNVHTGANAMPSFSSNSNPVSFGQDLTWANTWPDSVAGFKLDFANDIQAHENDESTDGLGAADGQFPDSDAGQVVFQVIVK